MSQVFEDDWTSVRIGSAGPVKDGTFHIEVDAVNHIKSTSTHVGQITGDVTNFTISITETFPQIPGVTLTYVGTLAGEVVANKVRHLMICGVVTLPGFDLLDEKTIRAAREIPVLRGILERDAFDGQIQEIWVATKP